MSMDESIKRNIKRYGNTVTLDVVTDGQINYDTGKADETIVSFDKTALIARYGSKELLDGVIGINDIKCTLQHSENITKRDRVRIDGETFSIMNVGKLKRNDVVLKYTLQLRS